MHKIPLPILYEVTRLTFESIRPFDYTEIIRYM